jgi:RNA polymerase-binding transcription factor DksA
LLRQQREALRERRTKDREDKTIADVNEAINKIETGTAKLTANAISEPKRLLGI